MRDQAMDQTFRRLAVLAGDAIMAVRRSADLGVMEKADCSPVTEADLAADRIICAGLSDAYPGVPVVTEERADSHGDSAARRYFLVDPLDGTKEFVRRQGEFTVNIALIEDGRPVAGVVYAPAVGRLFRTAATGGAVEERGAFDAEVEGAVQPIACRRAGTEPLRVVASKSHRDAATDAYIAQYPVADFLAAGSSLKFCLVATGEADFYPRLGPTMEWDTAAGQAVLEAAGGRVDSLDDGGPLRYGKPERRNPYFAAAGPGVEIRPAQSGAAA